MYAYNIMSDYSANIYRSTYSDNIIPFNKLVKRQGVGVEKKQGKDELTVKLIFKENGDLPTDIITASFKQFVLSQAEIGGQDDEN